MNPPEISVILPAYNTGAYLGKAIRSVLDQSFSDFELLIINDGSTDETENIIRSFSDPRIVYIKNEQNCGLANALNKGIDIARGKYIARMDGDDICLPTRFTYQKAILDQQPDIAAVASTIIFINKSGEQTGSWELDKRTIYPATIKSKMPYENCIAHPTIMMRSAVLKEMRYEPGQENMEDYDLWLRLMIRGYRIAKVEEPQLWYRVLDTSITGMHLKRKNFFFKHFKMKRKLLRNEWKEGWFNRYAWKIFFAMWLDLLKGTAKSVKKLFTR
jgi:glycosyltransferase involved in cell wall biosynthesis